MRSLLGVEERENGLSAAPPSPAASPVFGIRQEGEGDQGFFMPLVEAGFCCTLGFCLSMLMLR